MTKNTKFLLLIAFLGLAALIFIGKETAGLLGKNGGSGTTSFSPSQFFSLPVGEILGGTGELKGEREGQVNALFLGIGGEEHPGELLTDTIMLASFSPAKNRTDIFSIPRDLAVKLPEQDQFVKVNSLYILGGGALFPKPGGVEMLQSKIREISGLETAYYFVIDFEALKR